MKEFEEYHYNDYNYENDSDNDINVEELTLDEKVEKFKETYFDDIFDLFDDINHNCFYFLNIVKLDDLITFIIYIYFNEKISYRNLTFNEKFIEAYKKEIDGTYLIVKNYINKNKDNIKKTFNIKKNILINYDDWLIFCHKYDTHSTLKKFDI